jgi:hypothetical protein
MEMTFLRGVDEEVQFVMSQIYLSSEREPDIPSYNFKTSQNLSPRRSN